MKEDPRILLVDEEEWGELTKANAESGPDMSRRMMVKITFMRLLHPFGVHYLVPAYGRQPGVDRWVNIGSTCWFC